MDAQSGTTRNKNRRSVSIQTDAELEHLVRNVLSAPRKRLSLPRRNSRPMLILAVSSVVLLKKHPEKLTLEEAIAVPRILALSSAELRTKTPEEPSAADLLMRRAESCLPEISLALQGNATPQKRSMPSKCAARLRLRLSLRRLSLRLSAARQAEAKMTVAAPLLQQLRKRWRRLRHGLDRGQPKQRWIMTTDPGAPNRRLPRGGGLGRLRKPKEMITAGFWLTSALVASGMPLLERGARRLRSRLRSPLLERHDVALRSRRTTVTLDPSALSGMRLGNQREKGETWTATRVRMIMMNAPDAVVAVVKLEDDEDQLS